MVSVEMAAALPVLVVLMLSGVYAVQVVGERGQCQDAAREVARASARGDSDAAGRARDMVGASVAVAVSRSAGEVRARVSVRVHPGLSWLPAVTVDATATAADERSVGSPP